MREDGLKASEDMLAADTQGFIDFFNKIKDETQQATKNYEDAKTNKGRIAGQLRKIIDDQNGYISRINKSLEMLRIYNEYKIFLEDLSEDQGFKDRLRARKAAVKRKIEEKDR